MQQGSIVWVRLVDPSGGNEKCRPAVVLAPPTPDGIVYVAAATTKFEEPLPHNKIMLPWHANGHRVTGLKKATVVVCNWIQEVSIGQIETVIGRVPDSVWHEIIGRLPPE